MLRRLKEMGARIPVSANALEKLTIATYKWWCGSDPAFRNHLLAERRP
jgi:hypothetical protein